MRKSLVLVLGIGLLSACGNEGAPEGQVVATINGQEITRQQLNAAMRAMNISIVTNAKDAQNMVLEQLVTKELLVQAAKQDGLDKTQSYLEGVQNASDSLLISLYAKKITGSSSAPYNGDVSKFIADNPSRFAQRQILTVDQIRAPIAGVDPAWIKNVSSLDQLAAQFKAHNINFERGNAKLDSATIDKADFERLMKLRPGQPFVVRQGEIGIYSVVVGAERAPIPDQAARDAARQFLSNQAAQQALKNRIKVLRQDAKVKYQNGFAPPKDGEAKLPAAASTDEPTP